MSGVGSTEPPGSGGGRLAGPGAGSGVGSTEPPGSGGGGLAGPGAGNVDLRRLELRDLNEIERIERDSYPTPWSRSMFAGELAKPSSISVGAFDPGTGTLVGYLVISRYVDAWHVMNVAVAPSHRRRGIARTLLEHLFDMTGPDERRGYTLEVRVSNEGAIKLYEQLGFVTRGVRRGYYTDNREDALIMWRDPVTLDSVESDRRLAGG